MREPDQALPARATGGDAAAQRLIFECYADRAYRTAFRRLRRDTAHMTVWVPKRATVEAN